MNLLAIDFKNPKHLEQIMDICYEYSFFVAKMHINLYGTLSPKGWRTCKKLIEETKAPLEIQKKMKAEILEETAKQKTQTPLGYFCCKENKIAGFIICECLKTAINLDYLLVKEEHRRLGIGTLLCQRIMEKSEGLDYLEVKGEKETLSFYTKIGFAVVPTIVNVRPSQYPRLYFLSTTSPYKKVKNLMIF